MRSGGKHNSFLISASEKGKSSVAGSGRFMSVESIYPLERKLDETASLHMVANRKNTDIHKKQISATQSADTYFIDNYPG
jgi:hypothetical protein